jgi:hypothetical protein
MEYNAGKKEIKLDRELSKLDNFVIDFCKLLKDYVIVSGYVSILLGRSRATEDVDLLVPRMSMGEFEKLWEKICDAGFKCINTSIVSGAFDMLNEHAIRFYKDIPMPNIEFKMIKNNLDEYSFKNKIKVRMGKEVLYVSPLELQIAYKLFLSQEGNEKDLEDAKYLYDLFKEKLNKEELLEFVNKLDVKKEFEELK